MVYEWSFRAGRSSSQEKQRGRTGVKCKNRMDTNVSGTGDVWALGSEKGTRTKGRLLEWVAYGTDEEAGRMYQEDNTVRRCKRTQTGYPQSMSTFLKSSPSEEWAGKLCLGVNDSLGLRHGEVFSQSENRFLQTFSPTEKAFREKVW